MKTYYLFKPAQHWNCITEQQYTVLSKFYSEYMLKIEMKEEQNEME